MNAVVAFALKQRVLMVGLFLFVLAAGGIGFTRLNIEAYPDPVPPLVDIVTQSAGQSAEEIERYITIPIEIEMAGIPHVSTVRTISLFGLSDVKVQFTYDFTYSQAEQWVINRIAQMATLPNGALPQISPTSPIGEIYRYRVVGPPGYSVTDLKTLEDWVLERRFKAVPGVIDVTGWGGKTKTYEVQVDPRRLQQLGVSLPQVLQGLGNSNLNVGGQTVNIGPQSAVVRGVGLIHSVEDIEALRWPPRTVNVKPSRFGSVERLFAAYDYCVERGIGAYGGGQFELGVGRGHIQLLASLFHPDTPNDVAPGGYNETSPAAGLPSSPLTMTPRATGFLALTP